MELMAEAGLTPMQIIESATGDAAQCLDLQAVGTIQSGKWADFIVIDRDYLTIPEDDIGNVRVLMTVVGGKTIHLVPSLAKEFEMEATGAQVTHGGAAANW
jgi:hypothetical protein